MFLNCLTRTCKPLPPLHASHLQPRISTVPVLLLHHRAYGTPNFRSSIQNQTVNLEARVKPGLELETGKITAQEPKPDPTNPKPSSPHLSDSLSPGFPFPLPTPIWDTHTHISDPIRYPLSKSASYKPHAALLKDLLSFHNSLGLRDSNSRIILVQPSTYGFDNSCLLDTLDTLGERARGVIVIDAENFTYTTEGKKEMIALHSRGVSGVRINLKSTGKTPSPSQLLNSIQDHAKLIDWCELKWVIQIHVDMALIPSITEVFPSITSHSSNPGPKILIDHYGCPPPRSSLHSSSQSNINLSEIHGWDALKSLLSHNPNIYVKLSAPYRLSALGYSRNEIREMSRQLFGLNDGKQVVWGSDWPHTRFENQVTVSECGEFMKDLEGWNGGTKEVREKLFRDNAERLWEEGVGEIYEEFH